MKIIAYLAFALAGLFTLCSVVGFISEGESAGKVLTALIGGLFLNPFSIIGLAFLLLDEYRRNRKKQSL